MKKRNSFIRAIIAFLLSLSLVLLSGCIDITIPAEKATINSLDTITFFSGAGSLDFYFYDNTVTYENSIVPDLSKKIILSSKDASEYHELMKTMFQEMLDNGDKYSPVNTLEGELTRIQSNISILFYTDNNETSDRLLLIQYGKNQPRPARWNEFAKRTKELIGCDIEAMLFDPYGSETKEVKDLNSVSLYFDKGYIDFTFDSGDNIYCGMYGPEKGASIDAKNLTEIKYWLRAICDDVILHENEYSQDIFASDINGICQMKITYSDGTSRKDKSVWLTESNGRTYPDNWDKLIELIKQNAGFDANELIAATGDVIPFGKIWCTKAIVYSQPSESFTPDTETLYCFFKDGWMFGNDGLPEFWENISEVTLSKEDFDDLFDSFDAHGIRNDVKQAYRYDAKDDVNGTYYYLIITNSGELYLACVSSANNESIISWMLLLECEGPLSI